MQTDGPIEVPAGFQEAMAKVDAAKPSQADICDALPEECAVEVTTLRGEKRIDYKKIPVRNADGTANKYAKNLADLHAPAARIGAEVVDKLVAGDYDDHDEQAFERERKLPLSPDIAERAAVRQGLRPVKSEGEWLNGRWRRPETGLWVNADGRLVRLALVGTSRSARIEVYGT
jgi:hypothetical protein